jgi:hypothetical protein
MSYRYREPVDDPLPPQSSRMSGEALPVPLSDRSAPAHNPEHGRAHQAWDGRRSCRPSARGKTRPTGSMKLSRKRSLIFVKTEAQT